MAEQGQYNEHTIELEGGVRVRVRVPTRGSYEFTLEGGISPSPDFEILCQGNRSVEQIEAQVRAWMLELLVPLLSAYPDFLARVMSGEGAACKSPFRAAIVRWGLAYRARHALVRSPPACP